MDSDAVQGDYWKLGACMSHVPLDQVGFNNNVLSPFGDLLTAELTPLVQLDFVYGINTQTGISTVVSTATVDTSASRLRLQTSTSATGSAIFRSRRPAKYRPGQGCVARFTVAFTTGVASSTQLMGVGDDTNAYAFGFNGATFGILHRNAGADTWVAQTSWNGDKCNGTGASTFNWDKTKGCVCQIKYPYLGYGNVTFWVQNPLTSRWILCHTVRYNNSSAAVQVSNPNIGFYAQAINAGNTTNLTMYCGSVGIFLAGPRSFVGSPKWAVDSYKNTITTETCLINLRNATTYNGVTNRSLLRLQSVTFSSAAAAAAAAASFLRFKIGATIGGAPSYACVNGTTADGGVTITSGNSVAAYDTAGTTVANGTFMFSIGAGDSTNSFIDLTNFNLFIAPGEILTVSGFSSSSATLGCALTWTEDI